MHLKFTRLTQALTAAGVVSVLFSAIPARAVTMEELAKKLEALEAQNAELKAKVEHLEAAQQQQATQVQQQAAQTQRQAVTIEEVQKTADAAASKSNAAEWAASTTVSSYGEITYSRPTQAPEKTNVDIARAVIGMTHRFDDQTKMVGEWEWEHAVTSSTDAGEAEVEQLYVEREFDSGLRGKAGLFLMPVGLINQNHEPTAYYGVFRPDVDTKIVPSTWREVGVGLSGDTNGGLTWEAGLTTGPNLSKWDASTDEGLVRGPLAAIHGEGQFAAARDLSVYAALSWRGVPGLLVGGSVFAGDVGQHQQDFLGNNSHLLLLDIHSRYEIGPWDFAAEYVRGTISDTEALNTSFATSGTTNPTLVPALFDGGYVQAAYRLHLPGDYTIIPFTRYEVLNTAAGYGSLPASLGGIAQPRDNILTAGASFRIGEGVVVKADYRKYKNDKLPSAIPDAWTKGDSFNMGLGYSF
ncbi:MAG: hypothetical protein ACHP7O_11765 [Burkholderiales bacterium]